MRLVAIEIVFIFILSLIATIVFLIFFSDIRNFILNLFREEQQIEEFEIEIISRENFSQHLLLELTLMCVEKASKSKLRIENFTCYYLFSEQKFENVQFNDEIKINDVLLDFKLFDIRKKNVLIVYNKKINKVYFIN